MILFCALCVIFALIAMASPAVRYLNTLLAIWLFISAWALGRDRPGTVWNSVLVALAMFVISLLPEELPPIPRERPVTP